MAGPSTDRPPVPLKPTSSLRPSRDSTPNGRSAFQTPLALEEDESNEAGVKVKGGAEKRLAATSFCPPPEPKRRQEVDLAIMNSLRSPKTVELSLMHIIVSRCPHWTGSLSDLRTLQEDKAFIPVQALNAGLHVNNMIGLGTRLEKEIVARLAFNSNIEELVILAPPDFSEWTVRSSGDISFGLMYAFGQGYMALCAKIVQQAIPAALMAPEQPPIAHSLVEHELDINPELTKFTKDNYDEARRFWKLPYQENMSNEPWQIKFLNLKLMPHQAMFVVWWLNRVRLWGFGFNADKPGLGKTLQFILVVWVNGIICMMAEETIAYRKNPKDPALQKRSHLLRNAPPGTKCPSSQRFPFSCYCEGDSLTSRASAFFGPAYVVCLKISVIKHWAEEVENLISTDSPFQLEIVIGHDAPSPQAKFQRLRHARAGEALFDARKLIASTESLELTNRRCNILLITSPSMLQGSNLSILLRAADEAEGGMIIRPGIVGIDEMHKLIGSNTGFLQYLLKWLVPGSQSTVRPPQLMPMSGTPWLDGPIDIRSYWQIGLGLTVAQLRFMRQRRASVPLEDIESVVRQITSTGDGDGHCSLRNLDAIQKTWHQGTAAAKRWGKVWATAAIQRAADMKIPGTDERLIGLPPRHLNVVPIPKYPRAVLKQCNDLMTQYVTQVVKGLQNRNGGIGKANDGAASARKPTTNTIARNISQRTRDLRMMVSFPSLLGLLKEGFFDDWRWSTTHQRRAGVRQLQSAKKRKQDPATMNFPPINFNQPQVKTAGWLNADEPSLKKAAERCARDPKALYLKEIHRMLMKNDDAERKAAQAQIDRDPEKYIGCADDYLPKSLVLTEFDMIATLGAGILREHFPGLNVEVLTGAHSDTEKGRILSGFKDEVVETELIAISEDGDGGSESGVEYEISFKEKCRPRVLVATIGQIGEGENLQRANFLTFVEPSYDPQRVAQARERIQRVGQTRTCYIFEAIVDGLGVERYVSDKHSRREVLLNAAQDLGIELQGEE